MRLTFWILTISLALFIACSKEKEQTILREESYEPADSILTPEERFSSSVIMDFINDLDDGDLSNFLETEIYKMGANYRGASVIAIFPSVWFVMLEKDGTTKNYLLQKYVNFKTYEYYFQLKETQLTITDVITGNRNKIPAKD